MTQDPVGSEPTTIKCANPDCRHRYPAKEKACPICGAKPEATREVAPSAQRHGWRLQLPNFVYVPLAEGRNMIGRATTGAIADVLQLFSTVSREHIELFVQGEELTISVPEDKPPVAAAPIDDAGLPTAILRPMRSGWPGIRLRSEGLLLCLGQCCFIKIDRGVA